MGILMRIWELGMPLLHVNAHVMSGNPEGRSCVPGTPQIVTWCLAPLAGHISHRCGPRRTSPYPFSPLGTCCPWSSTRRIIRSSAIVFPAWVKLTLAPVSATHHPEHASHDALAVGPHLDDAIDRHGMLVRDISSFIGGVPPTPTVSFSPN